MATSRVIQPIQVTWNPIITLDAVNPVIATRIQARQGIQAFLEIIIT